MESTKIGETCVCQRLPTASLRDEMVHESRVDFYGAAMIYERQLTLNSCQTSCTSNEFLEDLLQELIYLFIIWSLLTSPTKTEIVIWIQISFITVGFISPTPIW